MAVGCARRLRQRTGVRVVARAHLSLHTVKTHVHNAFTKLDIKSRGELAQLSR